MSYMITVKYSTHESNLQHCSTLGKAKAIIAKYAKTEAAAMLSEDGEAVAYLNAAGFPRTVYVKRIARKVSHA